MAKRMKWLTPERKRKLKTVGKWTALGLLTYEAYLVMVHRRQVRRDTFNLALQRAHQLGRPLYVLGDPRGRTLSRVLGPDYDCGDLCIDKRGCSACSTQIVGRPEDVLPTLDPNSAVIYATGLEYVDDLPAVFGEMSRISGSNIFVASVEPWSLTAWLNPRARRRVFEAPPEAGYVRWRDLPWRPGPSSVEQLSVAGAPYSFRGLRVAMGPHR